ncbi:MAG: hydrogenase maturation protease [Saprospirales bacterium]|jgi:hydrogenase maturation protease|nr:hydrogenase maturation protease [Saprospirales bacterium]MBK7338611.1 hydrogenase maturation protease [Saprospirales bacterium]
MKTSPSFAEETVGDPENRILILGIGNLLMGDEGVGVHLAHRLAEEEWPAGVSVEDGGTAGFQLMGYLDDYPVVILIDAALEPERSGQFRLIRPRFSKDYPKSLSTHDIGLKDILDGMQLLGRMPNVYLFVVSISDMQPLYVGLSPETKALLPEVAKAVRELVMRELKS